MRSTKLAAYFVENIVKVRRLGVDSSELLVTILLVVEFEVSVWGLGLG
jgi:cell shape-determining protein MreD